MNKNLSEGVLEIGKNWAVASFVCGILAVLFLFIGTAVLIPVILGSAGAVMARKANAEGYTGGYSSVGYVSSLVAAGIGLIGAAAYIMAAGLFK